MTREPEDVRDLRRLVEAVVRPDDDLVRVHLMEVDDERPWRPGAVLRAGGPPIGVDPTTRPQRDGRYFAHLVTIDLAQAPAVRDAVPELAGVRAVALFIRDAMDNEAFTPHNGETAVVLLTDDDLARGEWAGPPVPDPPARHLELHPVDVPLRGFDHRDDFYANEDAPGVKELWALYCELMSADRVGGSVIYFQGDRPRAGFLFQFSDLTVEVNLGDAGTMYVFTDDAYWSCH